MERSRGSAGTSRGTAARYLSRIVRGAGGSEDDKDGGADEVEAAWEVAGAAVMASVVAVGAEPEAEGALAEATVVAAVEAAWVVVGKAAAASVVAVSGEPEAGAALVEATVVVATEAARGAAGKVVVVSVAVVASVVLG